jgi:hypothetical protein
MNELLELFENFAVKRYPKRGTCPKSCFANGWHRVGLIPVLSVLDGGIPGDSMIEQCLECGAVFERTGFVIRDQPNRFMGERK